MDQTTAVLAVASPAWATRIRQHRAALRHIVESSLGRPCTDIRLCIIPVQAPIRPSHEPVKTQTRHIDTMRRLSKSTSNAKLAAALRRLVQQLENALSCKVGFPRLRCFFVNGPFLFQENYQTLF